MIKYKGKEPVLKMESDVFSNIRKVTSISKKNICIFMEIEKKGNVYTVNSLYLPKQKSDSVGHCIVDSSELNKLGTKYSGVVCGGGNITSEIKESKFFDSSFDGVNTYVCMNIDKSGNYQIDIVDGMFVFVNVGLIIPVVITKEDKADIEEMFRLRVGEWSYKDGYDPTVREEYFPPEIIEKNISWRDVV